jgi:hypothetical protein
VVPWKGMHFLFLLLALLQGPLFAAAADRPLPDELSGGGNDFARGLMGMMGGGPPALSLGGWYTPFAAPASVQFHQEHLGLPIYHADGTTLSLSQTANTLQFNQGVALANGVQLPQQFYRFDLGANFHHSFDSGDLWGAGLQLGEASDHPDRDSIVVQAVAYYSLNDPEHSHWIFSLLYSNNSTFLRGIPIPGVMYSYRTETFTGLFGFPFASIVWKPASPWTVSAAVFGTTMNAELACGNRRSIEAFVAIHEQRYSYMRLGRTNADDRVQFNDNRVAGGIRFPLFAGLQTELAGGWAFHRSILESSKSGFRIDSNANPVYFHDTWFAGWNFRVAL